MYFVKTPKLLKSLFPSFRWNVEPDDSKKLYLTFDDGPIEEITPWVVDILKDYNAKATFFCVGHNIEKYPDVYKYVVDNGHLTANHTYNHLSGWASENMHYFHNIRRCGDVVESNMFRPPYGRVKPSQAQFLLRHYEIVMWDVLSADFDAFLSPQECFKNVQNAATDGSIIVFHDSVKAERNMKYALLRTLDYYSALGYTFECVPMRKSFEKQAVLVKELVEV